MRVAVWPLAFRMVGGAVRPRAAVRRSRVDRLDRGKPVAYILGIGRKSRRAGVEKPPEAPNAVAADDGVGKHKKSRLHPASARALVLQLGALAAAVLSIVAAVRLVLPGGGSHKPVPLHVTPHVTLSLASESVHVTTLRDYLRSIGSNPSPKPSPDLDARGFSAPYAVTVGGYRRGTIIPVRFEVWRQTAGGDRYAVPATWDRLEIDRDPDSCTCSSTFIRLPRGPGRYRLVIGVFAPGVRETSPGNALKSVETGFRNGGQ
jgi:hypothetical protein